jgi:hypothetical protein
MTGEWQAQANPTCLSRLATPTVGSSHARVDAAVVTRQAGERNLLDVAVVGAAAAAEDGEVPELPAQRAIAPSEIGRIAGIEIGRGVKVRMAAR